MEAVVEQPGKGLSAVMPDLVSKVRRATARIFGCWHVDMSRPFSRGNETYRMCVACGARRRFDLEQWEMVGSFYYPERRLALYAGTRWRLPLGCKESIPSKLWREQHVIANRQK